MPGLKMGHLWLYRKFVLPKFPLLYKSELKKRCSAICKPQGSKQAEILICLYNMALPGSGHSSVFSTHWET